MAGRHVMNGSQTGSPALRKAKDAIRRVAGAVNALACRLPVARAAFLPPPAGFISIGELLERGLAEELLKPSPGAGGVYGIKNGIAFSDYGYVLALVDGRALLVRELSTPLTDLPFENHYVNFKYSWRYFNRIDRIDATVAVVNSTASSHNYYHWLIEALPRIGLVELSGAKPDLYFASTAAKYHRDSLEGAGVPEDRIVSPKINTCVMAKLLVVPSLIFKGIPKRSHGGNYLAELSPFSSKWLRSKFLDSSEPPPSKRLYLSRKGMAERSIANEDELAAFLQSKGFEIPKLDGLGVKKQAKLFNSALAVVAPNGAALANVAFCNPGAKIIDMIPELRWNGCIKAIAENGGQEYRKLALPSLDSKDTMRVDIDKISPLLEDI